jgi:hypothetical protein
MTASSPHAFVYVESEIPEGVTLIEWRRARDRETPRHSRVVVAVRRINPFAGGRRPSSR